jgi:hypothetical protein
METKEKNTRYDKGSTGFDTAFPPQLSDGRSGGVPRSLNTPPLRKPAMLATRFPEPSQGTPGTAICAVIYHPGSELPRQQHGDGGVEQPSAKRWKALIIRIKAKVKRWQAQIHRYYLKLMRRHVALTTQLTFSYIRLIVFTIGILRRSLFRRLALPYGAINVSIHDCRDALFRRRAVELASGGQRVITIQRPPLQRVKAGARSTDTRLTNTYFKLKR